MRLIRFVVAMVLASPPWSVLAQEPFVRLDSSRAELEVRFPDVPLANAGCGPSGSWGRHYFWRAWAHFRDSVYPHNHFISIGIDFYLPADVPLISTRFDSVLAATPVQVADVTGEPPMFARPYEHTQAKFYRTANGLGVRVRGRQAIDALLRTGVDSVTIDWCQRDAPQSFVKVRLERR